MPTGSLAAMQAEYSSLSSKSKSQILYTYYSTAAGSDAGQVATAQITQTAPAFLTREWSLRTTDDVPNVASSDFVAAFPGALGHVYSGGTAYAGTLGQATTFVSHLSSSDKHVVLNAASTDGNVPRVGIAQYRPDDMVLVWVFTSAVSTGELSAAFPDSIEVISL